MNTNSLLLTYSYFASGISLLSLVRNWHSQSQAITRLQSFNISVLLRTNFFAVIFMGVLLINPVFVKFFLSTDNTSVELFYCPAEKVSLVDRLCSLP